MAVSPSLLDAAASGTDATSYLTTSQTPTANALQLIAVANSIGTGPALVPTSITGCDLTWVQIAETATYGTGGIRIVSLWRALGASPSTGQLTIDFNGVTQTSCYYVWVEATGTDTTGTNGSGAIVQSATNTVTGTSITVTLAAFADATNNAAVVFAAHSIQEVSTQEAGYTELGDVMNTNPTGALAGAYLIGEDTSPSYSWATSTPSGAIAVEVKVAADGAPAPAVEGLRLRMLMGVGL